MQIILIVLFVTVFIIAAVALGFSIANFLKNNTQDEELEEVSEGDFYYKASLSNINQTMAPGTTVTFTWPNESKILQFNGPINGGNNYKDSTFTIGVKGFYTIDATFDILPTDTVFIALMVDNVILEDSLMPFTVRSNIRYFKQFEFQPNQTIRFIYTSSSEFKSERSYMQLSEDTIML